MTVFAPIASVDDVRAFIDEYFEAWSGTDENLILSYYSENVLLELPGTVINGKAALRDQFVRPFITGFPGNRHVVKNMIFGRDVVVVEWSFEAEHKGPFDGHAATDAHIEVPGCGVYEYDLDKGQITAARIYFDVGTLLKQLLEASGTVAAPVEHLDLATVIKVSQTVSGEMVLDKLLDTLM